MTEKFDYYDILGTVVPGVLFVAWVGLCFPCLSGIATGSALPETFSLLAAVALAVFTGQLIQAIGSLAEPLLYWSWGGRPSDQALGVGLGRYLPEDAARRIRSKLRAKVATEASDRSLYLYATQLTDAANAGRANRFNGLYAYHRSLVVLLVAGIAVALASRTWGLLATWQCVHVSCVIGLFLCILALAWYRTKQRSLYYVREVLLTAEKVMDERQVNTRQY